MVTQDGHPVAFFLTHGGFGDGDAFKLKIALFVGAYSLDCYLNL